MSSQDGGNKERWLDLDGLTDPERDAVRRFVAYLRTPEGKEELGRAGFDRFWDALRNAPASELSDEEVATIAADAVAFARRH
jgi:hypothetical protein